MGKYRLNAEWIPYMKAYRVYDPYKPHRTIAYEENIETADERAREEGYEGVSECDIDTMHYEDFSELYEE